MENHPDLKYKILSPLKMIVDKKRFFNRTQGLLQLNKLAIPINFFYLFFNFILLKLNIHLC